jgi:PhzF family phenazine biosynthesis protein
MPLTLYQVDAFTDKIFGGNPAAVIPLDTWLPDNLMQKIAMENNLAETVFFVKEKTGFAIRWFTPKAEINLCGHATLAAAYILFNKLDYNKPSLTFYSQSGPLVVSKMGEIFSMDFPSWTPTEIPPIDGLEQMLGISTLLSTHKNRDILVELPNEQAVRGASPDFEKLKGCGFNVIITSGGEEVDFVSRFFAPALGINEDPVTGSAHSQLIPYWSQKLRKTVMQARQLSERGGYLEVEQKGDRVLMAGKAAYYMKGEIFL